MLFVSIKAIIMKIKREGLKCDGKEEIKCEMKRNKRIIFL
jgi:hypothetical protein